MAASWEVPPKGHVSSNWDTFPAPGKLKVLELTRREWAYIRHALHFLSAAATGGARDEVKEIIHKVDDVFGLNLAEALRDDEHTP